MNMLSLNNPYSNPMMGGHNCACNQQNPMMGQNPMMSAFGMLAMTMMSMMSEMMQGMMSGQFPMSQFPGQFGQQGLGGGSPFANFLGGGQPMAGYGGYPMGGGQAQGGQPGSSGAPSPGVGQTGPVGNVGNINVDRLIAAIPSSYHSHAKQHWPAIVAEANKQGVTNKAQLAYILATTVHESGAGKYMKEIASGSAYEGRRDLGNTQSGDGVRYKGRGYVQITGRSNYSNWSKRLGIDLVGNPQLAERPEIAAKILVGGMKDGSFTGKGLNDYINGSKTDFQGARRIVNGTDKASTFAATAQKILAAMG